MSVLVSLSRFRSASSWIYVYLWSIIYLLSVICYLTNHLPTYPSNLSIVYPPLLYYLSNPILYQSSTKGSPSTSHLSLCVCVSIPGSIYLSAYLLPIIHLSSNYLLITYHLSLYLFIYHPCFYHLLFIYNLFVCVSVYLSVYERQWLEIEEASAPCRDLTVSGEISGCHSRGGGSWPVLGRHQGHGSGPHRA